MYKNRYWSGYHTIGPLLFIFYINDIVQAKGALKINMYADVSIMFKSGNNWNTMSAQMQHDLDGIQQWFEINRVKLSVSFKMMLYRISVTKLHKEVKALMNGEKSNYYT